MIPRRWLLVAMLAVAGAGWGLTTPLTKIAVSDGYRPFGIIFWQFVIGIALLGPVVLLRGQPVPFSRGHLGLYAIIAAVGTLLPNAASYQAAVYLPAGLIAILLSSVPMFAFAIALAIGDERIEPVRLWGLLLGLAGVVLIVGPREALPDRAMLAFVPLALVAPVFYGIEGNVVARLGTRGLDAIRLLLGASLIGLPAALVLALISGQWISPLPPWGLPDLAIVTSSSVHAAVYSAYVWLVARAGAVFAAQVAYLVTGFGVLWSMLLLQETYSGWIWMAMAAMFAGLFLVQPRPQLPPGPVPGQADDSP
ncbi:Permease of the drug/metabolite transporter (DMT) superfamily [Rhodovulum sp. P5]|uniref:DMT family transporter n=1 Tax=Rhodovulum sp. P5 TaxID=1564506 RepID=UPI0009C1AB82|nr:DMT family transporter [Rhodovulum sp. P5]ARE41931.1 Permease of the drug/metabolite transporter (DMT) superfamily [Rhodovulum sp. P5]